MIFPKIKHLKTTMHLNSIVGIWPFIFENKPTLRKFYDILSYCTLFCYSLFILSLLVKLIIILCNVFDATSLMSNLCITLLNSITLLRVKAMTTDRVKEIIKKILFIEKGILNSGDERIIKIYNSQAAETQTCNKISITCTYSVNVLFCIHQLYLDEIIEYNPITNETVAIKPLPVNAWSPIDQQKYFVENFLWQQWVVVLGATYISGSDIFAYSLVTFSVGQIKILKSVLSNFQEYSLKVKDQLNCSQEEASFITIRECILKHKEIIEYVNEYNLVMKNLMLLDFLCSSLQMASLVLAFLMTRITLLDTIYTGQFTFCMIMRLFINYWYANEVMVNSSEIGMALYSSKWYEEPQKVQKLMVIMLMRCNKELYLEIGPFGVMTLGTFLGILKATYSYMTVMYR